MLFPKEIWFLQSEFLKDKSPIQSELEIFWPDLLGKALVLANPTELKIFWQHLVAKGLVLENPTELEIFWQDFVGKALVLVNPDTSTKRLSTESSP